VMAAPAQTVNEAMQAATQASLSALEKRKAYFSAQLAKIGKAEVGPAVRWHDAQVSRFTQEDAPAIERFEGDKYRAAETFRNAQMLSILDEPKPTERMLIVPGVNKKTARHYQSVVKLMEKEKMPFTSYDDKLVTIGAMRYMAASAVPNVVTLETAIATNALRETFGCVPAAFDATHTYPMLKQIISFRDERLPLLDLDSPFTFTDPYAGEVTHSTHPYITTSMTVVAGHKFRATLCCNGVVIEPAGASAADFAAYPTQMTFKIPHWVTATGTELKMSFGDPGTDSTLQPFVRISVPEAWREHPTVTIPYQRHVFMAAHRRYAMVFDSALVGEAVAINGRQLLPSIMTSYAKWKDLDSIRVAQHSVMPRQITFAPEMLTFAKVCIKHYTPVIDLVKKLTGVDFSRDKIKSHPEMLQYLIGLTGFYTSVITETGAAVNLGVFGGRTLGNNKLVVNSMIAVVRTSICVDAVMRAYGMTYWMQVILDGDKTPESLKIGACRAYAFIIACVMTDRVINFAKAVGSRHFPTATTPAATSETAEVTGDWGDSHWDGGDTAAD